MSPLKLKNGRLHIGKHKIRIYLKDSANQWKMFIKWSLLSLLIIILGIILFNKKEYFQNTEIDNATQYFCPKQPCSQSGQKERPVTTSISQKTETSIPIVSPDPQQISHSPLSSKQDPPSVTEVQMKSSEYQQTNHLPIPSKPDAPPHGNQGTLNNLSPVQVEKNLVVVTSQETPSSQKETLLVKKFEEALQAKRIDEADKYWEELKQMNLHDPNKLFKFIQFSSDALAGFDQLYQKRIEQMLVKNELDKAKNWIQEWKKFNPNSSTPLEFTRRIESVESLQQCKKPSKTGSLKESVILECYKKVLRQDPHNEEAKTSLENLYQKRVEQILKGKELSEKELEKTKKIVQEWKKFNSASSNLSKVLKQIEVIELLQQCKKTIKTGDVLGKQSALECYQQVLGQDPKNEEAKVGIDHLYQKQVERALIKNELETAKSLIQVWRKLNPQSLISLQFVEKIKIFELLPQCKSFLEAGRLLGRKSALECYKRVLRQEPQNEESIRGMKEIEEALQSQVEEALDLAQKTSNKKDINRARKLLQNLEKVFPEAIALPRLKQSFDENNTLEPLKTEFFKERSPLPLKEESRGPLEEKKPIFIPLEEKKPILVSPPQKTDRPIVLPSRCTEIFVQESLGLQALTSEQKEFKKIHCNPKPKN